MAFVHLRDRWTRQPPGPVQVDWSNPITRRLRWVYAPFTHLASDVRLPGSTFTPDSDSSFVSTRHGRSLRVYARSAFTASGVEIAGDPGMGGGESIVCLVADVGGFNYKGPFVAGNNAFFGVDSSYRLHLFGSSVPMVTGSVIPNAGLVVAGANYRSWGRRAIYLNGLLDGENTDDGRNVLISRVGGMSGEGLVTFTTPVMLRWSRELSDVEHRVIARNPYQLFRAQRRIFYSLPASGIPVLSAATVTSITANSATPRVTITF